MKKPLTRVAVLASVALIAMGAATAERHLTMVRAHPMKDSVVTTAPEQIRVWFNQDPVLAVSRIWLEGESGEVAVGETRGADERSIVADVEGEIVPGKYTVTWRTAGDDGHPLRRSYEFTYSATDNR